MQHQDIVNIVSELPCTHTNGMRPLDWVNELIVHHSATGTQGDIVTICKAIAQDQMNGSRYATISGNPLVHPDGIQYHFVIANGQIYQVRSLGDLLWHAGNYQVNQTSLAVCIIGNYDEIELSDNNYHALCNLSWMLSYLDKEDFSELKNINTASGILDKSIRNHGEVVADACPGKNVKPKVVSLRDTKLQSGIDYWASKGHPTTVSTTTTVNTISSAPQQPTAPVNTTPVVNTQVSDLSGQISSLQAQLGEANNTIASLNQRINSLQDENSKLVSENATIQGSINTQSSTLEELKTQITNLTQVNSELQNQLNTKNTQLSQDGSIQSTLQDQVNGLRDELSKMNINLNTVTNNANVFNDVASKVEAFLVSHGL